MNTKISIELDEKVIFKTDDDNFLFHNGSSFSVINFICTDPSFFPMFELKNETTTLYAYADEISPLPHFAVIYCQAIEDGVKFITENPSCTLKEMTDHVSKTKNSESTADYIYIKGFVLAYYKM